MPRIETIEAPYVTVTITARVLKLCPVKDEVDDGQVTITYRTAGQAFELHALAGYLSSFRDRHLSHEDLVAEVLSTLQLTHPGGQVEHVAATYVTAGMHVTVTA